MSKTLFILNGRGTSGKDEFFDRFNNLSGNLSEHYSFINFTKNLLSTIPNQGKSEDYRKLLAEVNTSLELYGDIPFKDCSDKIKQFYNSDKSFLFIDCRRVKDIKRFKSYFNCYSIFIVSHRTPIISNSADSDAESPYNYDFYIDNTGDLNYLGFKIKQFYNEICSLSN